MKARAFLSGLTVSWLLMMSAAIPANADDSIHIRLGVRGGLLFRQDSGYFDHARVFIESPAASTVGAHLIGDPIPPAGGFHFEAGVEVLPRLSFMGSFRTMTDGVKTGDDTRLSLTSTGWVFDARVAVLRAESKESPGFLAQIELLAGIGRFSLSEQLVDRALFDGTKEQSSTSAGGRFGVDASGYLGPVGLVVGYAYNLAPASIGDRLGGTIAASGHEITFGLAARFLRISSLELFS